MANYPPPPPPQIEKFRQRAMACAERAKQTKTVEARKTFEDLAKMYEQMAHSVARLEALWLAAHEHKM